jgi:hypothetical protein
LTRIAFQIGAISFGIALECNIRARERGVISRQCTGSGLTKPVRRAYF